MHFARVAYECAYYTAILALGIWWGWGDGLAETFFACLVLFGYLMMNGASPLGWLVTVAMTCITQEHWTSYMNFLTSRFGDLYDGHGGYALVFGGYVCFAASYIIHGLFLLPFDASAYGKEMAKSIKIQPNARTPLKWGKLLSTLAVNFVVVAIYVALAAVHSVWSRGTQGYHFGWTLPSKQEQVCCYFAGVVWNEVMFYYSHRALHSKALYPKLHKKHHEYTAPFALAAIYCGPIEMVVSNLWPFLGMASIFRFHTFFLYCWVTNAIMGTQTHHSGHKWPWMTLLDEQPNRHDLHHELFNVNFGNVGVLDMLHGTHRDHEAHYKVRNAREKST